MANRFIEDPNNLNNLYHDWSAQNVVFNRATIQTGRIVIGNAFTGAVLVSQNAQGDLSWDSYITGPADTNLTIQNITWTNATGLNTNLTNLVVSGNITGQSMTINGEGNIASSFIPALLSINQTGTNGAITYLKCSVISGTVGYIPTLTSSSFTSNSVIIPSSSATTPYTGNVNINNSQSGEVLYVSSSATSPFTITFPNSPQNGFKYEVIANGSFTKPVTLAFPTNTLNGTLLSATGSAGFPANQRFTALSNCVLNGTGMSQSGDHYWINTDTTNFYISGISALGSAVTTS